MWYPELGAFDAAYAFRDLDHMLEVAHGELIQPLWDELLSRYGVRVLDTWVYGSRHITSNRPIRHPDDLRGFRLRLPAARVWQSSGEALGASLMPVAFAEVHMALQQGMADGQEDPIPTIQAMGFHAVVFRTPRSVPRLRSALGGSRTECNRPPFGASAANPKFR